MNKRDLALCVAVSTGIVCAAVGRLKGLEGYALGAGASVLNLLGLWFGIRLFTVTATGAAQPTKQNVFLIVLSCFVKMPLFIAAGFLSWRIGQAAPACFMAGVAMVYSLMVGWAVQPR